MSIVWKRYQSLDDCAWQSFHPVDHLRTGDKWIAGPINKWIACQAYNTCHNSLPCFFPICLCKMFIFEDLLFLERLDDLLMLKDPFPVWIYNVSCLFTMVTYESLCLEFFFFIWITLEIQSVMLHNNSNLNGKANLNVFVVTNYIKLKADEDQSHWEHEVCRDEVIAPGSFSISECLKL